MAKKMVVPNRNEPLKWRKTSALGIWEAGPFKIERRASGRHGWYGDGPWHYWAQRGEDIVSGPHRTLRDAKAAAENSRFGL